jgi:hypothetical protein
VATADTSSGGFRRWRRSRPFWGGLLLLISGLELFLSANLTIGDLAVHFGPEGFLSYLLPLLLVLCGTLTWLTPGQRLFYGILGMLTAVYSLVGLNLGGFGIGMLIGILGGSLTVAWGPPRPKKGAVPPAADAPEEQHPADETHQQPVQDDPAATMIIPGFSGGPQDTAVRPQQPPPHQEPPHPPSGGGIHRKALVITLVPLLVTTALVVAGGQRPARAEGECPEGLPSRPAAAAKKEAARQSAAKPKRSTVTRRNSSATAKPSASASASPTSTETDEDTGNVIVDGWNDFVDGVGDLLGVGEDDSKEETTEEKTEAEPEASAEPSADPEPSTSAGPDPSTSADPSAPATDPSGKPDASGAPDPSTPASSGAPSPTPSLPDVPCLGPRVFKEADPDDTPTVALDEGLLETDSLTMHNSTYDGVIDLSTAQGTKKVLKFSMTKAVNKPFSLTVNEPGKHTTLIESKELTTEGNVRFYTPKFQGNLFGVIPVTFTPEEPPPLTLPILWFTKVKIELAYVRCDTLTGDPLSVVEKP